MIRPPSLLCLWCLWVFFPLDTLDKPSGWKTYQSISLSVSLGRSLVLWSRSITISLFSLRSHAHRHYFSQWCCSTDEDQHKERLSRTAASSITLFSLLPARSLSFSLCLYDFLSSSYFLSVICCSPHLPLSLSFSSSFLCVVLLFLSLWLLLSQSMQTVGFPQHWVCCFGLFCKKYTERICQNVWHFLLLLRFSNEVLNVQRYVLWRVTP